MERKPIKMLITEKVHSSSNASDLYTGSNLEPHIDDPD
jgi:hypothetical protein